MPIYSLPSIIMVGISAVSSLNGSSGAAAVFGICLLYTSMLVVTKNFSRVSGKYYMRQQRDLGAVDGFIEEMLDGQKVVKVFCHEEAAKADFAKVNESLRESADMANRYANLLMPINANIGWLSYALVALSLIHISRAGGAHRTVQGADPSKPAPSGVSGGAGVAAGRGGSCLLYTSRCV